MKGMRLSTTLRLAVTGGSSDRLRIGLTLVGSAAGTILLLAAANVVLIGDKGQGRYRNDLLDQRGLHQGIIIAIVGLMVPLVLFVAQCSRIGAPARDRRLAAFRMAGATPGNARAIAAAETGIAALGGAVLGAALFALLRQVLSSTPDASGRLAFPTDVAVPWWVYLGAVIALPTIATVGAVFALRRVAIDPLGVVRRKRQGVPAVLPLVLLGIGTLGLTFFATVFHFLGLDQAGDIAPLGAAFVFFVCVAIGLTLGSATLAQRTAAFIVARTRRPALLIASRRTLDAPFRASRPTSAVLVAVFVAAAIQQTRENFLLSTSPGDTLYADTFDLLNIVLVLAVMIAAAGLIVSAAESITERRRTLAMLVATGTPRATIARAVLAESLLPLVPGVVIASVTGTLVARGFFGARVAPYLPAIGNDQNNLVTVPIPWGQLGVVAMGTLLAVTAISALALAFLPASTSTVELRAAA